jgi:hypothetical protein
LAPAILLIAVTAVVFLFALLRVGVDLVTLGPRRLPGICRSIGALSDFIQFHSVEPYTAAFWTVMEFNALALRNFEIQICIYRAFHGVPSAKFG